VRTLTGGLLGFGLGMAVVNIFQSRPLAGILQVGWLIAIEFAVAYLMHKTGKAEPFIRRYEESVRY